MSMKNSNDTIGNRTRDLPACSAVPQSTAPPRAPPVREPFVFGIYCFPVLKRYELLVITNFIKK
jgi:hypothetical protein